MDCPGCNASMHTQTHPANYQHQRAVEIDVCSACCGIWFDDKENLQLAPQGVLALMKEAARAQQGISLLQKRACPRCQSVLVATVDMQRNTRFQYDRCPSGHGRFITFFQFLREKHFIKPIAPEELRRLKEQVRVVGCTNCGAPVDLELGTACTFCHAALALLDQGAVEQMIGHIEARQAKHADLDPKALAAQLAFTKAQIELESRKLNLEFPSKPSVGIAVDVVRAALGLFFG